MPRSKLPREYTLTWYTRVDHVGRVTAHSDTEAKRKTRDGMAQEISTPRSSGPIAPTVLR